MVGDDEEEELEIAVRSASLLPEVLAAASSPDGGVRSNRLVRLNLSSKSTTVWPIWAPLLPTCVPRTSMIGFGGREACSRIKVSRFCCREFEQGFEFGLVDVDEVVKSALVVVSVV